MVLQLQVWAFMLLTGSGARYWLRPARDVESDGLARPAGRDHSVHHVGVVDRRHDRPC